MLVDLGRLRASEDGSGATELDLEEALSKRPSRSRLKVIVKDSARCNGTAAAFVAGFAVAASRFAGGFLLDFSITAPPLGSNSSSYLFNVSSASPNNLNLALSASFDLSILVAELGSEDGGSNEVILSLFRRRSTVDLSLNRS